MYKGTQPAVIITFLAALLVACSVILLYFLFPNENSALTGSTVMVQDERGSEALASVAEAGRIPFDSGGKHLVDFELREEIEVGDYVMSVTNVKTMSKLGQYLNPDTFQGVTAHFHFIVIQLSIVHQGTKEGYVPQGMFQLTDGHYVYDVDKEGTTYLFDSGLFAPVLRTGVKRNVKAAFDVPPGEYWLLVHGDRIYRMKIST